MTRCTSILLLLVLAACGLPRDSDGTLDRVRGGTMRVGVVIDTPWTKDSAGVIGGVEGGMARDLAASLGARIEWVRAPEGELLAALQDRELDLVIGGLRASSPWKQQVAFTRPFYVDTLRPRKDEHVLAVAPGENAFLMRVESMLIARQAEVPALLRRSGQ